MPVALHSGKIDNDGVIRVHHTFYAATESAARKLMENHAAGCAAFGPALASGRTIEIVDEIDAIPTEESFHEFTFGDDGEPDEDEDEEEEDPDAEPEGVE